MTDEAQIKADIYDEFGEEYTPETDLPAQLNRVYGEMLENTKPDDAEIAKITNDRFRDMHEDF